MDVSLLLELLLVLVLILLNGFFSGSEIAMITVRLTRLDALIEQGHVAARKLKHLRSDPDHFFATLQIGVTVVGVLASTLGGASAVRVITPLLAKGPVPWLAEHAQEVALSLVVAVISFLSLVLGELIPKSLGMRYAEKWAFLAVYPISFLNRFSGPFVRMLTFSSNLVLRPFGDQTHFTEARVSKEELEALVEDSTRTGAIQPSHSEILYRAIQFPELRVRDIAVPYTDMVSLDLEAPVERQKELLLSRGHSRMPVTRGSRDNVVGWVSAREILNLLLQGKPFHLEGLIHPPYFVPSSARVEALLKDLQSRHLQLAIVVDEFGGVEGLATIEDIVEELVGEIYDGASSGPAWKQLSEDTWLLPGTFSLSDVSNLLDVELEPGDYYNTVGGLLLAKLEHIPQVGETLESEGLRLTVKERTDRRVKWVEVKKLPAPPPDMAIEA